MCRKKKKQRKKTKKGEEQVEQATSRLSAQGETIGLSSLLCQKLHIGKLYSYLVIF